MLIKLNYEGQTDVELQVLDGNKGIICNATKMALIFGKKPIQWIRLEATKELISELINSDIYPEIKKEQDLIFASQSVDTWIHKLLILDFAQWLSTKYRVWLAGQLENLLNLKQHQNNAELLAEHQELDLVEAAAQEQIKFARTRKREITNILYGSATVQEAIKIRQERQLRLPFDENNNLNLIE